MVILVDIGVLGAEYIVLMALMGVNCTAPSATYARTYEL